jgi:hypothetical protein
MFIQGIYPLIFIIMHYYCIIWLAADLRLYVKENVKYFFSKASYILHISPFYNTVTNF